MPAPHESRPADNLPASLSSFVGRQQEMADVQTLLSAHRLVTLTGPGGGGKTRLALAVAGALRGSYPDGVWLVELAPLAAETLVPQAVTSALGLREEAGRPVGDLLVHHLRARSALLLLDNCEHLVAACAALAASLLPACPDIRLLATSREPLGVPGEAVWVVPPLTLPEPQPWRSPSHKQESLAAYRRSEAIQLFVARAATASPGFRLTAENGMYVAEICRRLDGLPLAVELAAARLRAFSARQIAERLGDRFRLLGSGPRAAPARHQTLTATLDWSYELLTVEEKQLLGRLAVFADGWTLEAAGAVCAGETIRPGAVIPLLSDLVDKSLVVVDAAAGRHRYRLLDTVRHYASRKLAEAGEVAAVHDRHLSHFIQWAEMATERLSGPAQQEWLERFEAEHDNLRAAHDWSQGAADRAGAGLRLAVACGFFWRLRGYLSEGRERLGRSLDQAGAGGHGKARAPALLRAAHLAYLQSDYDDCRWLAQAALDGNRQLDAEGRIERAQALDLLAKVAIETGDYERAPDHLNDALHIYQELDYGRGIANTLMQLGGWAMRRGDYEQADAYLARSLTYYRDLTEPFLTGSVLSALGELALRRGRYDLAVDRLGESLALRRSLDDRLGIAASLGSLAWAALLQADYPRMRLLLGESLAIRTDIGDQGGIAWCLEKAAEALILEASALPAVLRRRVGARAARVFAAAAGLRAPLHSVMDPSDRPAYELIVQALRADLGEARFAAAWGEGGALPLSDVVEAALAPAFSPEDKARLSQAQADRLKYGGLSPRERQTAALIAQGKSNRAIAEILVVREKTVETYVTRILNKLGFDSRVQIATWAVTTGLAGSDDDAG